MAYLYHLISSAISLLRLRGVVKALVKFRSFQKIALPVPVLSVRLMTQYKHGSCTILVLYCMALYDALTSWEVIWFHNFPEVVIGICYFVQIICLLAKPKLQNSTLLESNIFNF